jgi:glyoxylase-like metal-dependent hydrolase (beta-lactamase superfamily II)
VSGLRNKTMKKNIKTFLISFNILLCVSISFAQQQEVKPVKLSLISDGLYEILDGRGSNGGVFIGDNCVLVIDAKMDKESVDQTIEEIKKITDKPVQYLVNTHSDGDHVNGNQFFPEDVIIISHENCRKEFFLPTRDGSPSDWNKPELASYVPEITFTGKMDIFPGSIKVELWYFGAGHTTGDAVVYIPSEKTAFLGDQFFKDRPQLIHSYKGGNSFEHVKTLTKMLETLDADKYCSGHSEIVSRQAIQDHISLIQQQQQKIRSLIDKNKSLDEIKGEFSENEARLVESIFNEIKAGY